MPLLLGTIASPAKNFLSNYESIQTVVATGSSNVVTFSSIPNTYKHLQIRVFTRSTTTTYVQSALYLTFNGDTAANYSFHQVGGDGASTFAGAAGGSSNITTVTSATANGSTATFGAGIIDIIDYSNTNKYKTVRCFSGLDLNGTPSTISLRSGGWRNTNAITSITLTEANNNIAQYSHIALYGIK
jgi:hypothetical protein